MFGKGGSFQELSSVLGLSSRTYVASSVGLQAGPSESKEHREVRKIAHARSPTCLEALRPSSHGLSRGQSMKGSVEERKQP